MVFTTEKCEINLDLQRRMQYFGRGGLELQNFNCRGMTTQKI